MAAERYGGRHSPGAAPPDAPGSAAPPAFRNRRARRVSLRARLMFLLPTPLLLAGLGSIGGGRAAEMIGEIGGFGALILGAWLLNEGLRAEEAYNARTIARPPAIPRKIFAALFTGGGVALADVLSLGHGPVAALTFGAVAALAQLAAFGIDPLRRKGMDHDNAASERIARAVDAGEATVREIIAAAARIGDRGLEGRIERLCDQARAVFRTVERDPRDLARARRFLTVYLTGLRDATVKFSDLYGRAREPGLRGRYEALLVDMETSFETQRTHLLEDNRSDLDIEIEVLRERLHQDGLVAR